MLQLPFITRKHTQDATGRARGSCERCHESKEAIKLYIVDYRPLFALLDDLFNDIISSPPSRRGRKAMCGTRQGLPAGMSRGASRAALSLALCARAHSARAGAAFRPRARRYFSPSLLSFSKNDCSGIKAK